MAVVRRTLLLVGRVLIPHFLSFSQKTSVIAILPIIPYPSLILANPASRVAVKSLDCEKVLWGALTAGRDKKGELATTSLEFEFRLQFPCGSPSTELSDFRQSTRSGNKCECKQTLKTRAQGKDVITNVISANQHFESTFFVHADIQIPETCHQSSPDRRACSHAIKSCIPVTFPESRQYPSRPCITHVLLFYLLYLQMPDQPVLVLFKQANSPK